MPADGPADAPAEGSVRARLRAVAQRLGVDDAGPRLAALDSLVMETFALPRGDPAYAHNALQPGALPLEWSFSEREPGALRVELEPFAPGLDPAERLRRAIAAVARLVRIDHGEAVAARFEERARGGADLAVPRYGPFVGIAVHRGGPPEYKLYCDAGAGAAAEVPLAGAVPHFRSISAGAVSAGSSAAGGGGSSAGAAGGVAERVYHLCRDGLRLLDLERTCEGLGLAHRFPALLLTVLELTGGAFQLPPRSALLGIRRTAVGAELKLELVCARAAPAAGVVRRIETLLAPSAAASFRRWTEAVRPGDPDGLVPSVVSARISADAPVRLSVYAAEPEEAA